MVLARIRQVSLMSPILFAPGGRRPCRVPTRIMAALLMQLVDRLSVRAIFNRLDKRKLQNEIDTHRLFLVSSHFDRLGRGDHL